MSRSRLACASIVMRRCWPRRTRTIPGRSSTKIPASALCYTSGTTGRPKGVLYSHRATMLHTYAGNSAEVFGIRSVDRILPGASMYHACAWGLPYCVTYNSPTPASAVLAGEDAIRQRLKQGRASCGTDMKIVDAEGSELPWDGKAFGGFLVRGHWVCREYLNRGAEGAADSEGWLRTGDVCTIDPDGCAEIVDRSKDVLKSGGEWISSIALENIAVSHPAVAEAAIIAARHPKWQERPLLLVVPRAGAQTTR